MVASSTGISPSGKLNSKVIATVLSGSTAAHPPGMQWPLARKRAAPGPLHCPGVGTSGAGGPFRGKMILLAIFHSNSVHVLYLCPVPLVLPPPNPVWTWKESSGG